MKISDLFELSLLNLKRKKTRTLLTISNIVFCSFAITIILSINITISDNLTHLINDENNNAIIHIYYDNPNVANPMTQSVIDFFEDLDCVEFSSPIYTPQYLNVKIVSGLNDKYYTDASIIGIDYDVIDKYSYELIEGEYPQKQDKKYTAIAGEFFDYTFKNSRKPERHNAINPVPDKNGDLPSPFFNSLQKSLTIKNVISETDTINNKQIKENLYIIGKVKENLDIGNETSSSIIMDIDDVIELELNYIRANNIVTERKEISYSHAILKISNISRIDDIIKIIEDYGYTTSSNASYINKTNKQFHSVKNVLWGFGIIILLVSLSSIFNTICTSIHERKSEIYILQTIGFNSKKINYVFICESAIIGLIGSFVGVLICYLMFYILDIFNIRIFETILDTSISVISYQATLFIILFFLLVIIFITIFAITKFIYKN